ncbi:hypothetical protein BKA82DRAFT_4013523 [Pisolithus tinctorius]|nr:hypothetical protein BKA82DRAFT_4013523 [Pisolithus tinctorius]
MAPPPEIKKDKPRPQHVVQLPEGWEEYMFGLHDRRRSLTPRVSVSSQNSTAPILQEDQVEGTLMDEDDGEAEEVEVNVPADEGSQCPDDGASQLLDNEVDEDGSESSLHHQLKTPVLMLRISFPHVILVAVWNTNLKARAKVGLWMLTTVIYIKPSHMKLNEANLFCSWYWATQLKPDGEYNQIMKDIPKDNTTARKEKLKAVYKWSESCSAVPTNKSVKSIAVRVHNAKMQFSGLVSGYIEIAGVVMCLRDGNGTEAGLLGASASASSAVALELCC